VFAGLLVDSTANMVSSGPFSGKMTKSEFEKPLLTLLFSDEFVRSVTKESVLGIGRGLCGWFVSFGSLSGSISGNTMVILEVEFWS